MYNISCDWSRIDKNRYCKHLDQTENGQNESWCSGAGTRAAAGSLCTIDISPKLYSIDTKLSCQEDRIWA